MPLTSDQLMDRLTVNPPGFDMLAATYRVASHGAVFQPGGTSRYLDALVDVAKVMLSEHIGEPVEETAAEEWLDGCAWDIDDEVEARIEALGVPA